MELKLGVGATRGGNRVVFIEQMLGGDWEGGEAIWAKDEKHRVGEGIQREVSPVL